MKEFALKTACLFNALAAVMAFGGWAEGGVAFVPAMATVILFAVNTCGTYRAAEFEHIAARRRRAAELAERIASQQVERKAVSGAELITALVRWYPLENTPAVPVKK